jgi:cell division protease FtsH
MRPPAWVIGIAVLAVLAFVIVENVGGPAATPYSTFLDQLDAGNIASVTLQGTQIDGRFKRPLNVSTSNGTTQQDTFRSRVPDFGDPSLIPELRKQHVVIDVVSSSSWIRLLASVPLPMLLLLGVVLIAGIVRLVRGGKVQSGSTMPMHPMQEMIRLVSGLFGKPSEAASTATHDGDATKGR